MSHHRYFAVNIDGMLTTYATEAEARAAADEGLEWASMEADRHGEWPCDVDQICWGRILGQVAERVVHQHDDDCAVDPEDPDHEPGDGCLEGYPLDVVVVDYDLFDLTQDDGGAP